MQTEPPLSRSDVGIDNALQKKVEHYLTKKFYHSTKRSFPNCQTRSEPVGGSAAGLIFPSGSSPGGLPIERFAQAPACLGQHTCSAVDQEHKGLSLGQAGPIARICPGFQ